MSMFKTKRFINRRFYGQTAGGGAPPGSPPSVVNAWRWNGSGSSATVALSGNGTSASYTSGNLLMVWVACAFGSGGASHTLTDNLGSTYTHVVDATGPTSVGSFWVLPNAPGGITSLIYSAAGGIDNFVILQEVSGASTTAPITGGETATANSGSGTPTVGPVSHATANSLIVAAVCSNANTVVVSTPPAWGLFNPTYSQSTSTSQEIGGCPVLAAPTTGVNDISVSWTPDSSQAWAAVLVVIHP